MTTTWADLDGESLHRQSHETDIPANFGSLRSGFSGAGWPASGVEGQRALNTSLGVNGQHDGSSFKATGPRAQHPPLAEKAFSVSATGSGILFVVPTGATIESLVLCSRTATSSDGSNYWTWQLRNASDSLDLFATAPVSNADDLAADTPKVLTPDQNLSPGASKVLVLTWTATGSPTVLTELVAQLRGYLRNP